LLRHARFQENQPCVQCGTHDFRFPSWRCFEKCSGSHAPRATDHGETPVHLRIIEYIIYSVVKKIAIRVWRRWASWTLPTKLGLSMGVLGILLTLLAWSWPEFWTAPSVQPLPNLQFTRTSASNDLSRVSLPRADGMAISTTPSQAAPKPAATLKPRGAELSKTEPKVTIRQSSTGPNSPNVISLGEVKINSTRPTESK